MDPRNVAERIEAIDALDRAAEPVEQLVGRVLPRGGVKDVLHGVWIGHPLHPLLTDLPIGFWTSAFMLDIVGGRRSRPAADLLVGLGVASALPTAAAGVADWSELNKPERRTGLVHAAANLTATALYGLSFLARGRGRRGAGVALAMAGATAATVRRVPRRSPHLPPGQRSQPGRRRACSRGLGRARGRRRARR